jgi:hypothetical protein
MIMMNFKTITAALGLALSLALALGLALTAAAPALAKHRVSHPGYAARAQAIPGEFGNGEVGSHRATALRECNGQADRSLQYLWGHESNDQYRACMAQHGEIE